MTIAFAERDWVRPLAPVWSQYTGVTVRVSGNFNGDGKLDLAVSLGYGQVRMLLGDGTGQLAPGPLTTLKVASSMTALQALDINRDGKLDLVALVSGSPSNLLVLLGKGDGRLDPQTPFPLPGVLAQMTMADVNRDGTPDLLMVGNGGSSSSYNGVVAVLIAADGSLRVSDQQSVGSVMQPPVVTDLTGDGIPDLALAQTRQILIMRGLGQGQFESDHALFESWNNLAVASGDLNRDGKAELVVMGYPNADAGETTARLGIVDGATGKLRETLTELPRSRANLFVDDVYGDGDLDMIVGASNNMIDSVWVLAGKVDGSLVPGPQQEIREITDLSHGDFNGDGRPDLMVGTRALSVCLGLGDGKFAAPANRIPDAAGTIETGDVDGDGHPDLLTAHRSSLSVLRGQGNGSFEMAISIARDNSIPGRFVVADFDKDGRSDVCCGDNRGLWKGQVDGTFLNLAALPSKACRMQGLMVRDLDRDGILDLVSPEGTEICVMRGKTSLSFAPYQSHTTWVTMDYGAVAMADVDGDQVQDVVAALSGRAAVAVLYGKADGSYEQPAMYEVGTAPSTIGLVDWNGDGRPDIVVADEGELTTFQNLGQRAWGPRFAVGTATNVKRVLNVDWNGDGLDDLLAIAPTYPVTAIISRGDGRFESTTLDSSLGTYDACVADFNHDGRPDIASTTGDSLNLRVFLQKGVTCAP